MPHSGEFAVQGAPGNWIAPTLLNSWVDFDATTFHPTGYYKDQFGFVRLRGVVKNGTVITAPIFTLPVGFRPARQCIIAIISANTIARLDITAAGSVFVQAGGATGSVSLDNVSFQAAQV